MKTSYRILPLLLLLMLTFAPAASAQTAESADRLFQAQQYEKALKAYETLLHRSPNTQLYRYRAARCYYETGRYEQAVQLFETCAPIYPLRAYYLGESCYMTYRFSQAREAFETYIAETRQEDARLDAALRRLSQCALGERLMGHVHDIRLTDSLHISRQTFFNMMDARDNTRIPAYLRQTLITRDTLGGYVSPRGDRRLITTRQNGLTRISRSERLIDAWDEPVLLSDRVNADTLSTNFPFLLDDGITLYYAVQGNGTMGGYDIMTTRMNSSNGDYLQPENVGFPFNSTANDYLMAINEETREGWFVTDRGCDEGDLVIYSFVPNEETRILRDMDADLLRRHAMLTDPLLTPRQEQHDAPQQQQQQETHDFELHITDQIVYHRLSDFRSPEARTAYEQYRTLQQDIDSLRQQMDLTRTEWMHGDADTRSRLAPRILQMEQTLIEKQQQCADISMSRIRGLEYEFLMQDQHDGQQLPTP
ncbi:MAG: tetratricopeptide repeat protein [Paludibacteraceae bacterium]|nr:tetratricopeptide repeat protein [Paludibacteraceae bacterium]